MRLSRLRGRPALSPPGVRRVVIGVDFDEPSLSTARWIASHLAPTAEIMLVHVLPVPRAPAFLHHHMLSPEPFVTQVAPAMRGGLQGLAGTLGPHRVEIDVRVGEPAEQLAAAVVESDAGMVCVGYARPRRGAARSGRNTVERLLRRLEVPLLQGSPRAGSSPPTRLLAAVDGGTGSDGIIAAACALADELEARLEVLHVLDPDVRAYARAMAVAVGSATGAEDAEQALWGAAEAWLRRGLESTGVTATRSGVRILCGEPGPEMLRTCADDPVDLLVVGREGRNAPGTGLVGSTTRLILEAATTPVLVVPEIARPAPSPEPDGDSSRNYRLWPAGLRRERRPVVELVDAGSGDGNWPPPAARSRRRAEATLFAPSILGRPA